MNVNIKVNIHYLATSQKLEFKSQFLSLVEGEVKYSLHCRSVQSNSRPCLAKPAVDHHSAHSDQIIL